MKKKLIILCSISFMSFTTLVNASSVDKSKLTDFKSGDRAYASEVTGNFKELERAVNDNFELIKAHKNTNSGAHGGTGIGGGGSGGDGSAGMMLVIKATNADWTSRLKTEPATPTNLNFTSCVIGEGATVDVPIEFKIPTGITIRCQDSFTVNAHTTIIVGSGYGAPIAPITASGDSGGKGLLEIVAASSLDSMPRRGAGFSNGGYVRIISNGPIVINGTIKADGVAGLTGVNKRHGGGAGGIVIVKSEESIDIAGTIQANGANGANSSSFANWGGGGGGGIISLQAPVITDKLNTKVKGGLGGVYIGAGGLTVEFENGGNACGGDGGNSGVGTTVSSTGNAGTAGYVFKKLR